MGRGSGVCKFLLIIFTFSLLVQGTWAAEANNETNTNSNDTIAEINGSINGKINGTIYNETNKTIIGTINGTVNGTVDGTVRNTQMFSWALLLPLFFGCFLFLGWVCRYFPELTSCFVLLMLLLLLAVILLIGSTKSNLVLLSIPLVLLLLLYELYYEIKELDSKNRKLNFVLLLDAILLIYFIIVLSNFTKYILVLEYILVILVTILLIHLLLLYVAYNKYTKIEDDTKLDRNIEENFLFKARSINIIGALLIWPAILVYFYYYKIQYVTFNGIEDLKFPVYIITASLIGIISYSLLSIEQNFSYLIPEYEKLSKVWSYLRRFLIAPFIAIIGFYLLIYLLHINMAGDLKDINHFFVFVFSFIVGAFTKTIEEWIYAWVQKFLPGDKKIEFESRIQNEVKNSDFVKKLGLDEEVAYRLYNAKIRKIDELAFCNPKYLFNKFNSNIRDLEGADLPAEKSYLIESIRMYVKMAQEYKGMDEKSELVKELGMGRDLAFKLYYFADIRNIDDLKNCNPNDVFEKICDCKSEAEALANSENKNIEKVYEELCGYSMTKIKEFQEKAQKAEKIAGGISLS
ncbi:hypothetical protein [Methanosarcina vacuolata]|uniref:Uncharacterized protein n=1 Tax=Methanosarcina vacuolata Z-761 TaxID=1434123 RepID=A0A0E3Q5U0_9EURY|nr:hypothetical protein [Methanosarcina vacuolata]AKB44169.1 hypothetical protein MSVAZ_1900 [Methanosarcina vacuolata Z-761]